MKTLALLLIGICSQFLPISRGISCIQCLEPGASKQYEVILDVLSKSCIDAPTLSFLVDGSFSFDSGKLLYGLNRLVNNGQRPKVVIYLSNGASQRKGVQTAVQGFATNISPYRFRYLIQHDKQTRLAFLAIAKRILPIVTSYPTVKFVIIPSLEDNLDDKSFNSMLQLIQGMFTTRNVRFGRNPCVGCFPGNMSGLPMGVLREWHLRSLINLPKNGVISNDGFDISFAQARAMAREAQKRGSLYLYWNYNFQGLWCARRGFNGMCSRIVGNAIPPSERSYAVPNAIQRGELLKYLCVN